MNKQKGSLTIEASLALTLFLIIFLVFMSLGEYAVKQNKVRHCLNQALIGISARNNQLVMANNVVESLTGLSSAAENISEVVGWFSPEAAQSFNKATLRPYTMTNSSILGTNTVNGWGKKDMKTEIIRFFAYYYADMSFDESGKKGYEAIKSELEQMGIKIIEISGGSKGEFISDENVLTVTIKYNIDVPFSFDAFLRKDPYVFQDTAVMYLMK